jgi:alpha-tubulin suppressor-like RCC1 family protein
MEVSAGSQHTCALLTDGMVSCWGLNFDGALGDGTNMNRALPVPVVDLP